MLLPEQDFRVSSLLPLLASRRELTIIDDLNSLYSLATNGRKSHQLAILMRLLSYNARVNDSWVIATAFQTELDARQQQRTSQRSLTALGDLLIDTSFRGDVLKLKGAAIKDEWPNGEFDV